VKSAAVAIEAPNNQNPTIAANPARIFDGGINKFDLRHCSRIVLDPTSICE
jgi:hypothetical protein